MKKIILILSCFVLSQCTPKHNPAPEIQQTTETNVQNKWTIMIYMNGDSNLDSYTSSDINEIKSVDLGETVNLIILKDNRGSGSTSSRTELFRIKYPKASSPFSANSPSSPDLLPKIEYLTATINGVQFSSTITSSELNMLDENTLNSFIDYAQQNFPAGKYALMFWGHGDGWRNNTRSIKGTPGDDGNYSSYTTTSLYNEKIALSIKNRNIDVLSFDNCVQGSLENLWVLKKNNAVKTLIASPNNISGYGYNYTKFLTYFKNSSRTVSDLANAALKAYSEEYSGRANSSLVAYNVDNLDLEQLKNFFNWLYTSGGITEFNKFKNLLTLEGIFCFDNLYKRNIYTNSNYYLPKGCLSNKYLDNTIYNIDYTYEYKTGYLQKEQLYTNIFEIINNSSYPQKTALLNSLNSVIISGWKKENGSDFNYKGLNIYLEFAKSSGVFYTDYTTFINEYDTKPISVDSDWNEVIKLWNTAGYRW